LYIKEELEKPNLQWFIKKRKSKTDKEMQDTLRLMMY